MNTELENKTFYKAVFFLVITSFLWSTGGILIKMVSWNPMAISSIRSLIAAVLISIFIRKPTINLSKPQIIGAISYVGTVVCFVIANKLTTSANAILLQYTAPIYAAILGMIILKEKITRLDITVIITVLCGMILFFLDDISYGNIIGNIIAIISGICFACMTVALRYQKEGSPVETTLLGNIITFFIGLPFMFDISIDVQSIIGVVLLGIFQLGFSYLLYSYAIKYVKALEAILVAMLEPLLNPLWVLIFLGERPGFYTVSGGFIVLMSILVRSIILSKRTLNNRTVNKESSC